MRQQCWDRVWLEDIISLLVIKILAAMALNCSQQNSLSLLLEWEDAPPAPGLGQAGAGTDVDMEEKTCKGGWSARLNLPHRDGVGSQRALRPQRLKLLLK